MIVRGIKLFALFVAWPMSLAWVLSRYARDRWVDNKVSRRLNDFDHIIWGETE